LPELANAYNSVIYEKRLTHAPSTAIEQRLIAQAIRQFNAAHFNLESNVVYISVIDSQAQIVATGSVYNNNNRRFVLSLVEDLVREIKEGNIAILGCYQAQYRCFPRGSQKWLKRFLDSQVES
jgi:hypothetical protein